MELLLATAFGAILASSIWVFQVLRLKRSNDKLNDIINKPPKRRDIRIKKNSADRWIWQIWHRQEMIAHGNTYGQSDYKEALADVARVTGLKTSDVDVMVNVDV